MTKHPRFLRYKQRYRKPAPREGRRIVMTQSDLDETLNVIADAIRNNMGTPHGAEVCRLAEKIYGENFVEAKRPIEDFLFYTGLQILQCLAILDFKDAIG